MAEAYAIMEKLIAFPTVSRDGNIDLMRYIAALLEAAGISHRLFPDKNGDRASLFATIGPDCAGGVVLSGHTDVVPVDGQAWTSDPFRMLEREGRFFGRGTTDMKGFVACAIEAAILAKDKQLSRPLHLAFSYDEEIGCVGVRPMLDELSACGLKPDWVLVGEPTSMAVATGHKGKNGFRATCCGVAAHSALAPFGLNAIHLATDFIAELRRLQGELEAGGARDEDYEVPYTTLHTGIINGGTALNIVPEHCELLFEIRNIDEDDPAPIIAEIFDRAGVIAAKAKQKFPSAAIEIKKFNDYPSLATPRNRDAAQAAMSLSPNKNLTKVAFGTEGGLFREKLDTDVVICGPGSMDQGHKADEYVSREQMELCRLMLSRLVSSL